MASLSDKITSQDVLDSINGTYTSRLARDCKGNTRVLPWYLRREWCRIEQGIYPPLTETLEYINNSMPQFALHISKEDVNYVAYTPDRVSGEADRQLKTSLGKFLAKYYPHLSDDQIRDTVAEHMGEATDELELLEGQAIVDYYTNASNGTGSCMTKDQDYFSSTHIHPAKAYMADNIKLAVVRDKDGVISGRSLVFHASETDKRFIRVYGDTKLQKRLTRRGYKAGTWHGAKFNTIFVGGRDETKPLEKLKLYKVVMPYLDGINGAGSSEKSCVALIDGVLTGITSGTYNALLSRFGSNAAVCSTNTSGWLHAMALESVDFSEKCAITGKMVNVMEDQLYDYWYEGKIARVCEEVIDGAVSAYRYVELSGSVRATRCSMDTPVFFFEGQTYIEGEAVRTHLGFRKLNPAYYPTEQDWIAPSYRSSYRGTLRHDGYCLSDGFLLRAADAVTVIKFSSELQRPVEKAVHQEVIGKGYVKVHSTHKGKDMYAAPDVKVVKTPTGRKVVLGIHEVEKTWDGVVDFRRNLSNRYLLNNTYWVTKNTPPLTDYSCPLGEHLLRKAFEEEATNYTVDTRALRMIYNHATGSVYVKTNTRLSRAWNDGTTWEEAYEYMTTKDTSGYAQLGPMAKSLITKLNSMVTMLKAEMNAYDYNGQHDPSMNTCPEVPTPRGFATPLPAPAPAWPFTGASGTSTTGTYIATGGTTSTAFFANTYA